MPKTVTIDWNKVDRTEPVLFVVESERTASLRYKRSTTPVAGDNAMDRSERARRLIGQWSAAAGGRPLAVTLYDVTKPEPFHALLVCTDEGDLVRDDQAPADIRDRIAVEFKGWLKARGQKPARPEGKHADPVPPPPPVVAAPAPPPVVVAPAPPEHLTEPPASFAELPAPPLRSGFDSMERLLNKGKRNEDARVGWRGTLNKRFGMHLEPDEAELGLRRDLATLALGWHGSKVVSVCNDKGGAAKTPVALMLSAAMARFVALLVAMFDNNESAGLAKDRVDVEGEHTLTAKHLAAFGFDHPHLSPSELVDFTHRHADDRYHLIAAHHPSLVDKPMTTAEVTEVYRALARVYSLVVTDSGNTLVADNWLTMIQHTDQLVVPLVTAADRYERARAMLSTLEGFGGKYADLAANAVVVISVWRKGERGVAEEYAELFRDHVREVVIIPFDEHLGSNDLRFDMLHPKTQAAFIKLAASVARGLQAA